MLGLDTLDVGIGMALMFLFVSLICSALRELVEAVLKHRGKLLEHGIREMLGQMSDTAAGLPVDDDTLIEQFYRHPLIGGLFKGSYTDAARKGKALHHPANNLPSYIPAEAFARTILQLARAPGSTDALTPASLRAWVADHRGSALGKALLSALDTGGENLQKVEKALEQWFDGAMDRVSGWYTRWTSYWLFGLGLVCAVVMNIDAIAVMKTLSTDKHLREHVVAVAGDAIATCRRGESDCIVPASAASQPAPAASATASPSDVSGDDGAPASSDAAPVASAGDGSDAAATSASGSPADQDLSVDAKLDRIKAATARMNQVNWPIGWDWTQALRPAAQYQAYRIGHPEKDDSSLPTWLLYNPLVVLGWVITAIGVTFGASFWFDLLNKFMVVRSTIKPAEKSPEEPSKS